MLTSNVHLGYILTRGGGQAVQGGLSCPPPRISDRMDNQQFLLHHLLQKYLVIRDNLQILLHYLLQEYLVERDKKRYFNQFEMLTSKVQLGYVLTRGGGQAVQGGLSCPPPTPHPKFQRERIIRKFYYTIYYRNIS